MSRVVTKLLGAAIAVMMGVGVAVVVADPGVAGGSKPRTLRLAGHAGVAGDATNAADDGGTVSTSPDGNTTTTSGGETTAADPGTTATQTTTDATTTSGVQSPASPADTVTLPITLPGTTITETVTQPPVTITGPTTTQTDTETRTRTQTQTQTQTQTVTGTPRTVTGPGGTTTVTGPGGTMTLTSPGGTTTVVSPGTTETVTTTPKPVTRRGPRGYVNSLMSWTFAYTRHYTTVASLSVTGLTRGSRLGVACTGGGCPFHRNSANVATHCTRSAHTGHKRVCRAVRTKRLTRMFRGSHLHSGARLVVTITHPGWVGKYYRFGMRAGKTPTVRVTCLAPGGHRPGRGCTAN